MKLASRTALLTLSVCLAAGMPVMAGQILEGDANVDQRNYPSTSPFIHPPFYNAKVTVEVDDDGVITSVTDNGTGQTGSVEEGNEEFWENKNKPFWEAALAAGAFDQYVGKTLDDVRQMDPLGADATTGATMAGAAIHEAVINALEGKSGKTFLPGTGSVLPVEEITENQVIMTSLLPEDFDLQVLDIRWGVYNSEEGILPEDSYTVEAADGKVILSFEDLSALKPGKYFVNVVDASGTYRSPNFESGHGEEDAAQAPYFVLESGLGEDSVTFDGSALVLSEGEISDYLNNIKDVRILAEGSEEAVEQEPVGHHGTANSSYIVFDDNGVLNADGAVKNRDGSETLLFEDGVSYTVTIEAYGYPTVSFPYTKSESAAEESTDADDAADAQAAAQLLEDLRGTYEELFAVTNLPEYDQLWIDDCAAVVGEEAAAETAEMLKNACAGTVYGAEAIEAYGDGSEGAQFDCFFIRGVSQFVFDGNVISGIDENGEELFRHEYAYAGSLSLGGMMDGFLYETADEDAGDFRYFFMMPDTPATTYHIEFRYGSDKDDLQAYNEGTLAYWLAAGIPADRDEKMVEDVIALFCEENLSEMDEENAA